MRNIILDTNVLIKRPEVLSQQNSDIKLIIPQFVLYELETTMPRLAKLIKNASEKNLISIVNSGDLEASYGGRDFRRGLSLTDVGIIRLASDFKNRQVDVTVATYDREIIHACKTMGISTISAEELANEIKGSQTNQEVLTEAQAVSKFQIRHLVISFIIGGLTVIGVYFGIVYAPLVIEYIKTWGLVIIVLILGIFFYWIRCKFRLAYGIAEVGVGLLSVCGMAPLKSGVSNLNFSDILAILAGLYIIVRGMDNISKGLTNTKIEFYWRRVFQDA